jgi:hypothetical protein
VDGGIISPINWTGRKLQKFIMENIGVLSLIASAGATPPPVRWEFQAEAPDSHLALKLSRSKLYNSLATGNEK